MLDVLKVLNEMNSSSTLASHAPGGAKLAFCTYAVLCPEIGRPVFKVDSPASDRTPLQEKYVAEL
jgi:hypothetical protein